MLTERTRVHEAPEPVIGHPKALGRIPGTRNNLFQDFPKYIAKNLKEKLADEDRLRAEVLETE